MARLLEYAKDYPMVLGARNVNENPGLYIFTKGFTCGLSSLIFGKEVKDINSGLRIIHRDKFLRYEQVLSDRFSLTS